MALSHRNWLPIVAATLVSAATPAVAQEPCAIPPAGEVLCEDVVIDRPIDVRAYDPTAAEPTGYLHIRARSITITEQGRIDATGAGQRTTFVAREPTDGGGLGGGLRGIQPAAGAPAPGGGGAHLGMGGQGMLDDMSCALSDSALGGAPYDDVASPLVLMSPFDARPGMGSAGGASHCGDSGDQLRAGGRGGGVVILTAGTINLAGTIVADGEGRGELDTSLGGCGPGAGGGGTILVRTSALEIVSGAEMSARGGESPRTQDAMGIDATNSWGGGGGGGLITLFTSGDAADLTVDVRGGDAPCPLGIGGDGASMIAALTECVDADLDGFPSEVCGGPDCHDGAAAVHPDAAEVCDGRDNDCDGEVDESPDDLCPAGSGTSCVDGLCVGQETDAPPTLAAGPRVELGGGFCGMSGAPLRAGWGWLALFALIGWGARRRRR